MPKPGPASAGSERGQAVVVGAGIVGLCSAAYLQRDGWHVKVIDPDAPGEGCSYGNAGIRVAGPALPTATPGILRQVPGMLRDPLGPLAIRWGYLPRLAPWLVRFAASSGRARVRRTAAELTALNRRGHEAYAPLIEEAGAGALIVSRGALEVYETPAEFARARWHIELRRELGAAIETVPAEELRQIEPALGTPLAGGVYRSDLDHVVSPLRLSQAIAALIVQKGGSFLRSRVRAIGAGERGPHTVWTEGGSETAERVVVAAGAFSRPLAAMLGVRVPLDTERGYHMVLPQPGVAMRLPVKSAAGAFYFTPMEAGLRLAGTDELGGLLAPPDWRRADVMLTRARRLVPGLEARGAERWMGFRPSLPDSKPVISPVPGRAGVYLAFGHGHLGLSQGAVTGEAIADMAAGRASRIDMSPFRADRF